MEIVKVDLGERSYDILIAEELLQKTGIEIRKKGFSSQFLAVILTSSPIKQLIGKKLGISLKKAGISSHFIQVPDTERSKSLRQYEKVLTRLTQIGKSGRSLFLIVLGGGVVGDLGGFVAATFKRGIAYIHVPTTLLAQVDSAIGGKVGIDLSMAKNMVGAFWQPSLVLSDVSVLKTLPKRQFLSGLAEVIKYGVIQKKELFYFLEHSQPDGLQNDLESLKYIVKISSQCKAAFVEQDERDQKGKRAILNFGHTIGHAIETSAHYTKLYTHGEAISIGMVCATRIAEAMGLLKEDILRRLIFLLEKFHLPTQLSREIGMTSILKSYLYDKKFIRSKNRFVLPIQIGHAILKEGVPEEIIRRSLSKCVS